MFKKALVGFVLSIFILSILMGCTSHSSKYAVSVAVGDNQCGIANFTITVWIDEETVLLWNHTAIWPGHSPTYMMANITLLKPGEHSIRVFEKTHNLTNSTKFNLQKRLYIAMYYNHPEKTSVTSPGLKLEIHFSDKPFMWM